MRAIGLILLTLFAASACEQKMGRQPRYDPLEPSAFFEDGQSARHLPPGTVARGALRADTHLYMGISQNAPAKTFPFPITFAALQRGRERYDIYCAPCHSRTGDGEGMIVRRGFTRAASFHSERLREAPPGYIFTVITNGFGPMPDYRYQISPEDRWAIVAYLRALQLSRNATPELVPPERRAELAQAAEP
jgi:mono/diheme cytochrome c family protein